MMKRFILASLAVVLLLAGIGYLVYYRGIYVDFKPEVSVTAHFRTQGKEIQYLDGDTWKTMEIRGGGFILQHPRRSHAGLCAHL